jgi:HD-GYP domain-containing protein (c-di-GMP phosphodiesterase class II)
MESVWNLETADSKEKLIFTKDLDEAIIHGICVSNIAYLIGKEMGLSKEQCYDLARAGVVHDIGKMRLSRYLYGRNEDTLAIEEMRYVRMHPMFSYEILKEYDYSAFALNSVLYHHENYDGSGYPENLSGEEIPLGARILRVCDVFSALISDRPYREAFDIDTAVELMIDEVKNFDMKIFVCFQKVIHYDKIEDILGIEIKKKEDIRK